MIRRNINLDDISTETLDIGFVGEANHVEIAIHCAGFFKEYPDATAMMTVAPPVGEMYPVQLDRDDQALIWEISEGDLAYAGAGTYQLTFTEDEEIIKTVYGSYSVAPSLVPTGDPPDPIENWIERAEEALAEFQQDVTTAEAWAAGTRDGEPVPSTDPAYENNSKYYAEEAAAVAASIPEDYSELSADVEEMKSSKAPVIIETASGAIASFADGASGMPVKTLTVEIDPVQDLHGYDNPWPAGGGKNKLNVTVTSGTIGNVEYTVNTDGSVKANGTANTTSILNLSTFTLPAGDYIANGITGGENGQYLIRIYSGSTTVKYVYDGDTAFSLNADTEITIAIYVYNGCTVSNKMFYPMIRLSSVSDATFAPYKNECPISGWDSAEVSRTGKNLLKVKYPGRTNNYVTYTTNADGTISVSGTASGASYFASNYGFNTQYMTLLPPGTYTLHSDVSSESIKVYGSLFDVFGNSKGSINPDTGSGTTFTLTDYAWFTFQIYIVSGTVVNTTVKPMLEVGSTAHDYTPYSGSTAEYEFPQAAKPVYGAKMSIWQDGSGELVADRASALIKDLSTNYYSTGTVNYLYSTIADKYVPVIGDTAHNLLFSALPYGGSSYTSGFADLHCYQSSNANIYIVDNSINNKSDFITKYGEERIVWYLANPVTYQLTNQQVIELLKGANNVWADTGDVAVEYPADTKLYIDGKIAEIQALILENISNS